MGSMSWCVVMQKIPVVTLLELRPLSTNGFPQTTSSRKSSEAHGLSESTGVEYNKYSKEWEESINVPSSNRGNFGDILTESERKIFFKLGLFEPQKRFPKDPVSNR
ncbi:uncharacterized protein TNCV_2861421 [Trichonephila clavipes]|nr:uncharacterized protein TNCV_2861421 [Trichonephila clavipes]